MPENYMLQMKRVFEMCIRDSGKEIAEYMQANNMSC